MNPTAVGDLLTSLLMPLCYNEQQNANTNSRQVFVKKQFNENQHCKTQEENRQDEFCGEGDLDPCRAGGGKNQKTGEVTAQLDVLEEWLAKPEEIKVIQESQNRFLAEFQQRAEGFGNTWKVKLVLYPLQVDWMMEGRCGSDQAGERETCDHAQQHTQTERQIGTH